MFEKLDKLVGFDDSDDGINEDFEPDGIHVKELLSPDFIKKHTKFSSIEEIFKEHNIEANLDDAESLPIDKLDEVFSKITDFSSWSEMISEAIQEHLLNN